MMSAPASAFCQQPDDCRAKGDGLCRRCNMKRLHADPEFAARNSERSRERMKRLHADPEHRAKRGYLTPEQTEAVIEQIRSGARYIDIALDWLISERRVAQIASANGIRRHRSRSRSDAACEAAP